MKTQIVILAMTVLASITSLAAAGGSKPPVANTELQEAETSDLSSVMTDYAATKAFKVKVMLNGKITERGVDFILAGRYEPDAPIQQNLLILKSEDYPTLFKTGRISVEEIKQTGPAQFELKGDGGYWYGYEGECQGKWVFVKRTIEIKLVQKSIEGRYNDIRPVFGKVTDVQVCR